MLPITQKIRLIVIGVSLSIVIVISINLIFKIFPQTWETARIVDIYCYETFFNPALEPYKKLIIIDSNDPLESRSRSDYARMINQLGLAGVKAIAFDIRFLGRRENDLDGNRELVTAVREFPQVILAIDFTSKLTPGDLAMNKLEKLVIPDSLCGKFIPRILAEKEVDLPFDSLLSVTKHIGHINSIGKEYHHFPPVLFFEEKCYPSLPLELARVCFEKDRVLFRPDDIPLNRDGQIYVNFIPTDKFRPHLHSMSGATDLLVEQNERFQDAVVIIVNSAAETEVATLIGSYPRWAIFASVASQLLQNRHIDESSFYSIVFASILVFLGLMWFLFFSSRLNKKWQKMRFVFGMGNLLLFMVVYLTLNLDKVWLGIVVPLISFNLSMMIVRNLFYGLIRMPKFIDFIVHVLEAQENKYPIKAQSTIGEEEENAFFEPFFNDENFQEILQKIRMFSSSRDENRWLGNTLFDSLFKGELFHLLKNNIEKARAERKILRLCLSFDAPELICLPWELMHSPRIPPGFLVLNKRISITRYISLFQPLKKPEFHIPLKILVVVSNPSDLRPLKVQNEIKLLKKSLRMLRWGGDVRLRFCRKATLEFLRKELDRKPDIVHYIGHSYFDPSENASYLCFETEAGHHELVDEETIGNMLYESSIKLVILNSCESATASESNTFTGISQNLVKIGVPAVLAMQIEIPDETALWFSSVFYSKFLTNYSMESAVAEARRYIMERIKLDRPDWAIPALFMRAGESFQI